MTELEKALTYYDGNNEMPFTPEDALRAELLDLTGEVYLLLPHKFCPICGKELEREENGS